MDTAAWLCVLDIFDIIHENVESVESRRAWQLERRNNESIIQNFQDSLSSPQED